MGGGQESDLRIPLVEARLRNTRARAQPRTARAQPRTLGSGCPHGSGLKKALLLEAAALVYRVPLRVHEHRDARAHAHPEPPILPMALLFVGRLLCYVVVVSCNLYFKNGKVVIHHSWRVVMCMSGAIA